jgi:mannose-6-phosphate isomerase-like protein (cupin superfamily)
MQSYQSINIKDKLLQFTELWSPKIIAEMNDYQFKLVKIMDEFVWHDHKDTDEVFIVLSGEMSIDFRDGLVIIHEGELFVVPKGVEHRPRADKLCQVMVIEPRGVINTGDAGGALTAPENAWV